MTGRPFLSTAMHKVARKSSAEFIQFGDAFGLKVSDPKAVRKIAFMVEGEAKRMITEMGAVDTGNLRSTIVAAPTVAEALQKATTQAVAPETVL
jgi:hypothetical protein